MDEQGYRFGVGVLVVASMVIAVILILFFGAAPNFFRKQYTVTIRFDAAPGVATDTPVRKNGVQIGRVSSLQLLDDDLGVDLTLELDAQYLVRAGELPSIELGSMITNEAVVEFIPPTQASLIERFDGLGGSPRNGILDENEMALAQAFIKDEDFLSGGRVAPDPFDALVNMTDSFGGTFRAIEAASNQVTALASDVRGMLGSGDGEVQRIAQKMELTIDNFNETLDSIEQLFRDPNLKSALDTVAQRLPDLVDDTDRVMGQMENTLAAFEGLGRAAEETMSNVAEFTEPLGQNGERMVSDVMRTINNLDGLLSELQRVSVTVNRVAQRVNDGQGTIAKLIDDDQLYYTLINTLNNVETLTRRLEPVVDNARILSDKLARDPAAAIDLRGVLTGRPRGGIK